VGAGARPWRSFWPPRFPRIRLWVYEADLAARMRETRENDVYLPGCRLPSHVEIVNRLPVALEGAEIVLSAIPVSPGAAVCTSRCYLF